MNKIKTKTVGRITAAAALSIGLAASAVSVAAASDHGSRLSSHHDSFGQSHWNNFLGGVVTAVTTTSVSVSQHGGTPVTYTITGTTVFAEGMTTVSATDLVPGSFVGIQVIAAGSTTAGVIEIVPPRPIWEGGVVSAVTLTSVTITDHKGTPETFAIIGTTTFAEGKTTVLPAALVVGENAQIKASPGTPPTATRINISLSHFSGKVTLISGDSITVEGFKGVTSTIVTDGTTSFTKDGSTAGLTDIAVGDFINAQGLIGATPTTLDASSVSILEHWGQPVHVPLGHQRFNSGGSGSNGGSNSQGFSGHSSFQHGNFRR